MTEVVKVAATMLHELKGIEAARQAVEDGIVDDADALASIGVSADNFATASEDAIKKLKAIQSDLTRYLKSLQKAAP